MQHVDQEEKKNAQAMNESGIDYIWGSDQDELVQKQENEEKEEKEE